MKKNLKNVVLLSTLALAFNTKTYTQKNQTPPPKSFPPIENKQISSQSQTTKSVSFFDRVKSTFGFDKDSQIKKELKSVEKKLDVAKEKDKPTTDLEAQKQRLVDTQTRRSLKTEEKNIGELSFDKKMELERLRGEKWASKQSVFSEQTRGKKEQDLSNKEQKLFEKIKQKQIGAAEEQIKTVKQELKRRNISELEAEVGLTQAELRKQRAISENPVSDPKAQRLEINAQLAERRFEIEKLEKTGEKSLIPLKKKQLDELELDEKIKASKDPISGKYSEELLEKQKQVRADIKDLKKQQETQDTQKTNIFTKLKEKSKEEPTTPIEPQQWQKATPSLEAIFKSVDTNTKIGTGRQIEPKSEQQKPDSKPRDSKTTADTAGIKTTKSPELQDQETKMKDLAKQIKDEKDPEKAKTLKKELDNETTNYTKMKTQQTEPSKDIETSTEKKEGMSTKKKVAIGAGVGLGAAAIAGAAAGIAVAATQDDDNSTQTTPSKSEAPAPSGEPAQTESSGASESSGAEPTF